ncbi:MAG: exodeoxyribonuclease VII large subunit [Zoogloeaceae bacterium]|jgi:exodeoxyribonuclease VII large subunit|nr:exodeoxyribonuclease VII large subunit [Zoogloeaceae bacterium]
MTQSIPQMDPALVVGVGELNRMARRLLEGNLPLLWVAGEISGFTRAASGHLYFVLKDDAAQARCVLWRNKAALLSFRPENGQKVEARAHVTLFEARGDYQLDVETLRLAGQGALFERFLALKAKLAAEGLFRPERKRPLPPFVRHLALVTSPRAAALQDVLATLARRAPHVRVTLFPTAVQGEGAATEIAAALAQAAASGQDLILLCRGGGGMEDLWAFNEERVARAIAASRLPVVCGVGHETDFTIADFVADLRAPTPTAAAELAAPDRRALLLRLAEIQARLLRRTETCLRQWEARLDHLAARLPSPTRQLALRRARLAGLQARLCPAGRFCLDGAARRQQALAHRLERARPALAAQEEILARLALRLAHAGRSGIRAQDGHLERLASGLRGLDPLAVLARGYAVARDATGHIVRNATSLKPGDALQLEFHHGKAQARIESSCGRQLPCGQVQPQLPLEEDTGDTAS